MLVASGVVSCAALGAGEIEGVGLWFASIFWLVGAGAGSPSGSSPSGESSSHTPPTATSTITTATITHGSQLGPTPSCSSPRWSGSSGLWGEYGVGVCVTSTCALTLSSASSAYRGNRGGVGS